MVPHPSTLAEKQRGVGGIRGKTATPVGDTWNKTYGDIITKQKL